MTKKSPNANMENAAETQTKKIKNHCTKILPMQIIYFTFLHLCGIYGIYVGWTSASIKTYIFDHLYACFGGFGFAAGEHRLWSHRSYKAKWPLRLLLCFANCATGIMNIYDWSREHRIHHAFTGTNADPQSITRGFFFAHIGWLCCEKHQDLREKLKYFKCDDLLADPIVRFQRRFFVPLSILMSHVVPAVIPPLLWQETYWNAFFVSAARYFLSIHLYFLLNSVAHKYGNRPYNKNIEARENRFLSFVSLGEGWHNYHHTFPVDYATSEFGWKFDPTTHLIELMAKLGLAYDLKTTNKEYVKAKKLKSGDGST